ncbi:hypothetical protein [Erysipelothrix anatis]|uniref:hypothetical protein n=1 Tax=Erysipelothrix anatis TaxID=2683713 RepID=UPI00135971B2|nr:hypothetical protein [Erysipelothrix anatis]
MEKSKIEFAHEKMLEEMKNDLGPVGERLHVWLCNQDDELLINGILKDDRTIKGATEYCYAQGAKEAQRFGSHGVFDATPEWEHEMATKYFTSETIDPKELMEWPTAPKEKSKVETKEVVKEVIKEVVKEVYVTPTMEQIGEYIANETAEQKLERTKKTRKITKMMEKEHQESLFDE